MRAKRAAPVPVITLALVLSMAGCSGDSPPDVEAPVTLTDVRAADGTEIKQVRLADEAVERLGITTGEVGQAVVTVDGVSGRRLVIPYAAIVYDSDGSTWSYVNTAPGTYTRARVRVITIQGDVAVLSDGPPDGTAVVTQGAPELLGAEVEIAGEE